MYCPLKFKPQELVPPKVLELHGDNSYSLFHDHVLRMLDNFRVCYGEPIWINRYNAGYTESGLRVVNTKTGASKSKHKLAVAFDLKTDNMPKLRQFIVKYGKMFYINRVENFEKTIGKHQDWCHIEIGFSPVEEIYFFNP